MPDTQMRVMRSRDPSAYRARRLGLAPKPEPRRLIATDTLLPHEEPVEYVQCVRYAAETPKSRILTEQRFTAE